MSDLKDRINARARKAAYVTRQSQSRGHTCHWTGCERPCPPAMWGCKGHWFALPKPLRDAIWKAYRPGQENDGKVSDEYLVTAALVQQWIAGEIEIHKDGTVHRTQHETLSKEKPCS